METQTPDHRWLQPRDYAPDLAEQLRTVGIRRTWRDDLADLWFACRAQPWLAVTVFAGGLLVGAAVVLLPALAIAWVQAS